MYWSIKLSGVFGSLKEFWARSVPLSRVSLRQGQTEKDVRKAVAKFDAGVTCRRWLPCGSDKCSQNYA